MTAAATETTAFPGRADRHGVLQVPAVAVDGSVAWSGGLPEAAFVARLVAAADS